MSDDRQTYEEKVEAQLDKIDARLEMMNKEQEQLTAEASVEYGEQLEKLRARREELQSRLDDLRDAGAGAWQELQQGLDEALSTLETSVTNARDELERELT